MALGSWGFALFNFVWRDGKLQSLMESELEIVEKERLLVGGIDRANYLFDCFLLFYYKNIEIIFYMIKEKEYGARLIRKKKVIKEFLVIYML